MNLWLLAQAPSPGTDSIQIGESGIGDVTTTEWLLAAGIFVAALIIAVFARQAVERLIERSGPTGIARLGGRFAMFLVVVLGFFYALQTVDVAVGPLIGGLGIAGLAFAFALQEILGNFVAGILLQVQRPITVGDQIVTNELEGEVKDVNLRAVELRTFDGETVFLPSSIVLQNPIVNWTKTPTRRTVLPVGVAYDTDLAEAQRVIVEAVSEIEEIEDHPEVQAFVEEFGDSSINFAVRFWHGATIVEAWRARDKAAQAIKVAFDDAGITIPFPQATLWFGPSNTELAVRMQEGGNGGDHHRSERGAES
ncbi:MAG: mechanosensitive ion channel family protein [Solirubrobacterales bacterium]